jgi:hypothetical protein
MTGRRPPMWLGSANEFASLGYLVSMGFSMGFSRVEIQCFAQLLCLILLAEEVAVVSSFCRHLPTAQVNNGKMYCKWQEPGMFPSAPPS